MSLGLRCRPEQSAGGQQDDAPPPQHHAHLLYPDSSSPSCHGTLLCTHTRHSTNPSPTSTWSFVGHSQERAPPPYQYLPPPHRHESSHEFNHEFNHEFSYEYPGGGDYQFDPYHGEAEYWHQESSSPCWWHTTVPCPQAPAPPVPWWGPASPRGRFYPAPPHSRCHHRYYRQGPHSMPPSPRPPLTAPQHAHLGWPHARLHHHQRQQQQQQQAEEQVQVGMMREKRESPTTVTTEAEDNVTTTPSENANKPRGGSSARGRNIDWATDNPGNMKLISLLRGARDKGELLTCPVSSA